MIQQKKTKEKQQVRELDNEELDKVSGGIGLEDNIEDSESKESYEFEEEQELK